MDLLLEIINDFRKKIRYDSWKDKVHKIVAVKEYTDRQVEDHGLGTLSFKEFFDIIDDVEKKNEKLRDTMNDYMIHRE